MIAPIHMYRHAFWDLETLPQKLHTRYEYVLQQSGFQILNFMEHHFEPKGYTAIWLLGESHLAIHTFPEQGSSYVELSSCSKAPYDEFLRLLALEIPQNV